MGFATPPPSPVARTSPRNRLPRRLSTYCPIVSLSLKLATAASSEAVDEAKPAGRRKRSNAGKPRSRSLEATTAVKGRGTAVGKDDDASTNTNPDTNANTTANTNANTATTATTNNPNKRWHMQYSTA